MRRLAVAALWPALWIACSPAPSSIGPPDASTLVPQITLPDSAITVVRGESASFAAQILFAEGAQPAVVDLPQGVTATETLVHQGTSTITISASPDAAMASVPINVMVGQATAKMQLDVAAIDGSLDPAIGANGIVSVGSPVAATAATPDGSILAIADGTSINGFRIARITGAGALDPGFGTGGIVDMTVNGGSVTIRSFSVAPDGRGVIAYSAASAQGIYFVDSVGNITRVDLQNPSHVAPWNGGFLVSGSAGGIHFIDASNVVSLVASKPANPLGPLLLWSDGSLFVGGAAPIGGVTKLAPQSFTVDPSFANGGVLTVPGVAVLSTDFAGTGVVVAAEGSIFHVDPTGVVLAQAFVSSSRTTTLVPFPTSQTFVAVGTESLSGGDVITLARIDQQGTIDASFGLFGSTSFVRAHEQLADANMPLPGGAYANHHLWVASDDGVRAYRVAP